jgi:pyridoxal phosphate enzyme (YggS family)
VAVSKTVPAERLAAAVAGGFDVLGENRVQELVVKAAVLPEVQWHLVGHLQANKARAAVERCIAIESVDSLALARRLDALGGEGIGRLERLPVYLEVNIDADPAKAGFTPADLEQELPGLVELHRIDLAGLMTIGRQVEQPAQARPTFVALRELSERLRTRTLALGPALSMGMSDDFEVAVEEGATLVRIGRAIFGERPAA